MKYRHVQISHESLLELKRRTILANGAALRSRVLVEDLIHYKLEHLHGWPASNEVVSLRLSLHGYEQLERVAAHWGVTKRTAIERIIGQGE